MNLFLQNTSLFITKMKTQSGLSLIATILTLLIFSLFIAVAVSLVTTGAHIGVQETQGQQAFDIAEGGIHYAAVTFNFPNYVVDPAVNLGAGSFTVYVPKLDATIDSSVLSIDIDTTYTSTPTNGFIAAPDNRYWTMLCDDYSGGNATPDLTVSSTCEKISFLTIGPTSFSNGIRGEHNSNAASHLVNAVVLTYSWNTSITTTTTLNGNMSASTDKICVNDSTTGFTIPGFLQIADTTPNNVEDVFCRNTGTTTGVCGASCSSSPLRCFYNCSRDAYNGNGNGPSHSDTTPVYQSEIGVLTTSTGVISNVLTSSVRRTVQVNAGPSEE